MPVIICISKVDLPVIGEHRTGSFAIFVWCKPSISLVKAVLVYPEIDEVSIRQKRWRTIYLKQIHHIS